MQVGTHWSRQVHLFMIFHHRVGFKVQGWLDYQVLIELSIMLNILYFIFLSSFEKNWCWKRLINPKVKNTG